MRILVIEDDDRTAGHLIRGLSEAGHVVDRAADGATGLAMALEGIYDILILDRLLPELNGIEVVRRLRDGGADVPVLMLSALTGTLDKVAGLKAGTDDYIAKPFAFAELTARIDALVRRGEPARRSAILKVADL